MIPNDEHGLGHEEIHQFREKGYFGPFRVLPEEKALALNEEFTDIIEADEHPLDPTIFPARDRHRDTREIWEVVSRDEITHKLRSLYGEDVLLWLTNFPRKPPGGKELSPHQDPYFFNNRPANSISAWTALDRVTEKNGCLTFYPGTNDRVYPHVAPPDSDQVHPEPMADPDYYDDSDPVKIEMEPGETILFESQVVHGSYPNTSDRNRVALLARYTVPFVDIDYTHESMYEEGAVTPVCGENWAGLNPTAEPPTE